MRDRDRFKIGVSGNTYPHKDWFKQNDYAWVPSSGEWILTGEGEGEEEYKSLLQRVAVWGERFDIR